RVVLTASGGPFRGRSASDLKGVSTEDALKHPTWRMGRKITIDSATLMNKGLEVIEAHWLFGVRANQIDVVIHPQSVVHSMAERSLPVVLNAANEVAVARFLKGRIAFTAIAHVIESTMDAHRPAEVRTLAEVRAVDGWAREYAREMARALAPA